MAKKFNVGDKVRVVVGEGKGHTAVVVKPKRTLGIYDYEVEFERAYSFTHNGTHGDRDHYRYYWERELELVESVKETKSTTKFKPGDVAKVKSDLRWNGYYRMADGKNGMRVTDQMLTKRGKDVKIKSVTKTGKYMIEGSIFPWVDEMFEEPIVELKLVCLVNFKKGGELYAYLSDDTSITVDSEVIVPVGKANKRTTAKVVKIGYYAADELKFPIKDLKKVIEKVETPVAVKDIPVGAIYDKGVITLSVDISKIK
jgi:hypothetical protein